MTALLITSLVWAISFGLIGNCLQGIPSEWSSMIRMAGAFIVFLPFLRKTSLASALSLMGIGAVQFGGMYLFYMEAFQHIPSYQVALLTTMTPLYIVLLASIKARRISAASFMAALLAVLGGAGILWKGCSLSQGFVWGFILVQISNLCFAAGQIAYASLPARLLGKSQHSVFAYAYLGALLVTLPWGISSGNPTLLSSISPTQWGILAYLGIVASGLCFFLWNYGARQVSPGVLAVMNNLKIPLAALSSILLFGEKPDATLLTTGCLLIAAAFFITKQGKKPEISSKKKFRQ